MCIQSDEEFRFDFVVSHNVEKQPIVVSTVSLLVEVM